MEIIDGYLWITYTNDPQNPVNLGKLYDEEFGTQCLDYYPLPDGSYGVMAGKTQYLSHIEIPANYKGGAVTQILPQAFQNSFNLESIVLPDSITVIGEDAFEGCTSLTSITLPFIGAEKNGTSNTHFGYLFGASDAFSDSVPPSLKTVEITGGSNICEWAFYACTGLTSITLSNSVTCIGDYAFLGCTSLNSITIPDSITSIGNDVFNKCSSLTAVVIPDSVTSIGRGAFYNCTGLTSITFNGTVSQWNDIIKGMFWNDGVPATEVICSDGIVSLSQSP
jgi:hypothetical protein